MQEVDVGLDKSIDGHKGVCAVLVIGVVLRFVQLNAPSFTIDEAIDLQIAQKSVHEIIHEPNSFPPLYHLILKVWHAMVPPDVGIRWFSVSVGIGTLWFVYRFVDELSDRRTAVWAGLMMSISPFHIFYCQQARAYAFYVFLVSVACWLLARVVKTDRWSYWIAFATVNVVGNYTHYFFPLLSVTLFFALMYFRGITAFSKKSMSAIALVISASIPVLLIIKSDFQFQASLRESRPLNLAAVAYTYFSFFSGFTLGPSKAALHSLPTGEAVKQVVPFALCVFLCAFPLCVIGTRNLHQSRLLVPVLFLLILPVVFIGLAARMTGLTYNVRFVAWSQIGLAILLAAGCIDFHRRWYIKVLVGGLILVSALALRNRWLVPYYQNEDVRAAVSSISDEPPGQMLVCSGYMDTVVEYYMNRAWTVTPLPDSGFAYGNGDKSIEKINEVCAQRRDVWLFYSREFHGDPDGKIILHVRTRCRVLKETRAVGVRIFHISKRSAAVSIDETRKKTPK